MDIKRIYSERKDAFSLLCMTGVAIIVCIAIIAFFSVVKPIMNQSDPIKADSIVQMTGLIAITLSLLIVVSSVLASKIISSDQEASKQKDRIRDEKLKEIENSLDKFCIPLQNLLTGCYETNGEKQRIINEINANKHLAERYTTRRIFEDYIQNEDTHTGTSEKLLKHIIKDIEDLQKRFEILKEQELYS